jgi:hypothetical protein
MTINKIKWRTDGTLDIQFGCPGLEQDKQIHSRAMKSCPALRGHLIKGYIGQNDDPVVL